MTRLECVIRLPPERRRDRESWGKCLRDATSYFVHKHGLEPFDVRLRRSGLSWAVAVEGAATQLPADSDALASELLAEARYDWLLQYEVEGDEGFDVRFTEKDLERFPELAALLERSAKRQS